VTPVSATSSDPAEHSTSFLRPRRYTVLLNGGAGRLIRLNSLSFSLDGSPSLPRRKANQVALLSI